MLDLNASDASDPVLKIEVVLLEVEAVPDRAEPPISEPDIFLAGVIENDVAPELNVVTRDGESDFN